MRLETGFASGIMLILAVFLAGALTVEGLHAPAAVKPPAEPSADHRPDRLLIQPHPWVDANALLSLHRSHDAHIRSRLGDEGEVHVLEVPHGTDIPDVVTRYLESGLVLHAEPDYLLRIGAIPDDPSFWRQWSLHNTGQGGGLPGSDIDAVAAWDTLTSAANVIVAVIDSGIRYTHEDLAANMWVNPGEIPNNGVDDDGNGIIDDVHGMNAINNSGDPMDVAGHGTHVAGIIGAVGNNGKGIAGVAWQVQLMALRFIDGQESGATSDAIRCIDYARNHGAHVINASWGGGNRSSLMESAIRRARDAGIIFVTASGNDGINIDETPVYPASYNVDNIVVVTATSSSDDLDWYANHGANTVHLAAPGTRIYSTYAWSDSAYTHQTGTSMSAPIVAGAFALMRARYPDDDYRTLIDRLLASVDPLPALEGKTITGGRLNLRRALGPSLDAAFTARPPAGEPPLTVEFNDESFGSVTRWTWDFGDGSRNSNERNPVHTYEQPGLYTVTLTVRDTDWQRSTVSRPIAVLSNYRMEAATYEWVDPTGMTALTLSDNGVSPAQSLPFPFRFYGREHNHLYVGANGLIGFVNQGLTSPNNTSLPHPAPPNAILCPYWDDLNPAAGGSVRIGTVGTAPNRRVVISWVNVRHKSIPPTTLTFQVVLQEGSNEILFQYRDVRPDRSVGAGRRATVGIGDHSGHVARLYSYMGSSLLQNGQAIRFLPDDPAAPDRLVVHLPGSIEFSGFKGGPFTPDELIYTLENTGHSPVSWTGTVSATWAALAPDGGTLEPGQELAVSLSLTPDAIGLGPGIHPNVILFTDMDTRLSETGDEVSLHVHPLSELRINREPAGDGSIDLRFEGIPGWTCWIEASVDLVNWTVVQTHTADAQGIVEVVGLEIGEWPQGYYRARWQP